jgi:GNAT superfamily N-acetyltransferase
VWEQAGLFAVSATDPALGFLSTVSGVTRETVSSAIELVDSPIWHGVSPTVVVSAELDAEAETLLRSAGFARAGDRALAVRSLGDGPVERLDVVEDGVDFLPVLLAGYEVGGTVAAYIEAEHRLAVVRRFLVREWDTPIAAGAMTIHGDVAVLGGASTLRAHRGKGAQSRLLRHRLQVAAAAHCALAVATVVPDSVSAANLGRAGFTIRRRSTWTRVRP